MRLDDLARRPSEYVRDTGIPFLGVGLFWGIYGAVQLVVLAIGRTNRNMSLVVGAVGMTCALVAVISLLTIQNRIVVRRAGYAVPAQTRPLAVPLLLAFVGGIALVLILAWAAADRRGVYELGASIFVAFLPLCIAVIAWQKKSRVGFCFAAYLIALGVTLWRMRPDFFQGLSWLGVAIGWPVAIYGAILLRRFLSANPGQPEGAE